ncbi:selenocysteine-specific translation elongation factor [soil metagenome]
MQRIILGTAGHIDHGKTALVQALTGVDTDRLPEEKRRGITIDLGFANLPLSDSLELGIVDVPGHEAFVRNMLAGATGIDAALLVIAADEGVMPQTREHAAIIELLGVSRGVVALTKSDLVDDEWLDLVREEVRELLGPGGLRNAPVVEVSARTGAGLDALRSALATVARDVPRRAGDDLFRMPIDRVFTVRGTGTVVTGTVWSGTLHRDAQIRIEPSGFTARVRGLQRHGATCDEIRAGERAAVALAGVDRSLLKRGDTLLQGEAWAAASILTVKMKVLADAGAALRPRQRVRVSLGTAEVLARLALPDGELRPGAVGLAQLRLEQAVVARAGDRFVVRSYSPVHTIAGGTVLEPQAPKRKRFTAETAAALGPLAIRDQVEGVLASVLALAGAAGVPARDLPVLTGLPQRLLDEAVTAAGSDLARVGDLMMHSSHIAACSDWILRRLRVHHAECPLDEGIDRAVLRRGPSRAAPFHPGPDSSVSSRAGQDTRHEPAVAGPYDAALQQLLASGAIEARGGAVALAGHEPAPDPAQRALLDRLAGIYAAAGVLAPDLSELPPELTTSGVVDLLRYLERKGVLVRLGPTRWADSASIAGCVSDIVAQLPADQPLTIADFKQVVSATRKHLIPLLEYLDRSGVTVRSGDTRWLTNKPSTGPRSSIKS